MSQVATILALVLAPVSVTAALGYVAKTLIDHYLKKATDDIAAQRASALAALKESADERLAQLGALLNEGLQVRAEKRADGRERAERVRVIISRIAGPARDAIDGLQRRLQNILVGELYVALDPKHQAPPKWSMTHQFALESTMYAFGRYFAIRTMLREQLGDELFDGAGEREKFLSGFYAATNCLSRWPDERILESTDAQVFTLQQDAIGELTTIRDVSGLRALTYAEFLGEVRKQNSPLCVAIQPLESFLEGVQPGVGAWTRLQILAANLRTVRAECDKALKAPAPSAGPRGPSA